MKHEQPTTSGRNGKQRHQPVTLAIRVALAFTGTLAILRALTFPGILAIHGTLTIPGTPAISGTFDYSWDTSSSWDTGYSWDTPKMPCSPTASRRHQVATATINWNAHERKKQLQNKTKRGGTPTRAQAGWSCKSAGKNRESYLY